MPGCVVDHVDNFQEHHPLCCLQKPHYGICFVLGECDPCHVARSEHRNHICDRPACPNYEASKKTLSYVASMKTLKSSELSERKTGELIFPTGKPATVKCNKCHVAKPVTPVRMERRPFSERPRMSVMVVTEFLMPEGWTKIEITVCVDDCEKPEQTIFVCSNCTVTVG